MALENRSAKNTNTTIVKIGDWPCKVFTRIPKDIEKKLLTYRQEILNLGPDHKPTSLDEASEPIYFYLASLCVDSPYNKIEFWQKYDKASGRDCKNILDLILTHIRTGGEEQ
jgi:hypothetical protein